MTGLEDDSELASRGRPPQPTPPRARGTGRQFRRRRLIAACIALALLAAPLWYFLNAYPIGGAGADATFEIVSGETVGQVTSVMASKGIVSSGLAFRLDLLVTGTPTLQPGWYAIATSSSFSAVKSALSNGPNGRLLTVVTAETSWEIAQNLASIMGARFATRFESYVHNGSVRSPFQAAPHASLEGLLAPGDYVLVPGESPQTLLSQMIGKFVTRAASVGLYPTTTRNGFNANQLITIASIVEKEGYHARNMPKTATVIFNRLARSMPLQMDATVLYALHQDGGVVTPATLAVKSPYNTYLHLGLTPSAICVPSTEAFNATLHPPTGPWLYFVVVDASGSMAFSSTYAQQLANQALAARRGL